MGTLASSSFRAEGQRENTVSILAIFGDNIVLNIFTVVVIAYSLLGGLYIFTVITWLMLWRILKELRRNGK